MSRVLTRGQITITELYDGSGVSVVSTSIEYALSASMDTSTTYLTWGGVSVLVGGKSLVYSTQDIPTEWSSDILEPTDEKPYLWVRTTVEYSDGTKTSTYAVSKKGADGKPGKDGNSLNVKGNVVTVYKSFTVFKSNVKERHGGYDSEDAYYEMKDGTLIKNGDRFLLSTAKDYSEQDKDEVDMGYDSPCVWSEGAKDAPSIVDFMPGDSHTDFNVTQAQLNDAYMDAMGDLWVAGEKEWTNVGSIKGEKGDKGDDGMDAVDILVTPDALMFKTDDKGSVTTRNVQCTLSVTRGGKTLQAGTDYHLSDVYTVLNIGQRCIKNVAISGTDYVMTVDGGLVDTYTRKEGDNSITLPYTDGYIEGEIIIHKPLLTVRKRITWKLDYTYYFGSFEWNQKELDSKFVKYTTDTDGRIGNVESFINQNADHIQGAVWADGVERSGFMLDKDGVTMRGDKVKIVTTSTTGEPVYTALFSDGKLNADLIEVTHLYAKNSRKKTIGYWGDTDRDDCQYTDEDGNTKTAPLYVGGTTAGNAVFRVNSDGESYVENLRAVGGTIAGFRISSNSIGTTSNNNENCIFLSNDSLALQAGWSNGGSRSDVTVYKYRKNIHLDTDNTFGGPMVSIEDSKPDQKTAIGLGVYTTKYGSTKNYAAVLDAQGADKNDLDAQTGNHALFLKHGDILGFKLRHRRFATAKETVQLDNYESLVSIYAEAVRLNMPTDPEDGMMIYVRNHSLWDSYLQGATFEWIASVGSNYRKRSVTELTILPGRMMILTYDAINKIWVGGQFMN